MGAAAVDSERRAAARPSLSGLEWRWGGAGCLASPPALSAASPARATAVAAWTLVAKKPKAFPLNSARNAGVSGPFVADL